MSIAAAVFLVATAFVLYVLFGYPLLVALLARKPRPVTRRFEPRTVTIVMPVHNGARFLEAKLRNLTQLDYPRDLIEIVVLSDGSTDATAEIARRWEPRGVLFLELPHGGKALALNTGIARATGDILFFTDVRQEIAANALRELVSCFADPTVGVASGELVIREGGSHEEANVGLYWKYEKWIRRHLSAIHSVIGATGCIYAMRRSLAQPLPAGCLLDDVQQPLNAYFAGYRVIFEGAARAYDYPTKLDSEFHRKVRTLAGNYQLIGYRPALLLPTHPMWIHFLSHKFGRLLLPFALLAVFVSSLLLPEPWCALFPLAQLLFYAAALIDPLIGERSPLKRLTGPIRTFCGLMAASAAAITILFRGSAGLWKPTSVSAK